MIEVEARIVGFFMLVPPFPEWKLEHFWISPSSMGRALPSYAAALAIDADPNAEGFYLACGAERVGSIIAPIEGAPNRERPRLRLVLRHHSPSEE